MSITEQIDKLLALSDKATPGPWAANKSGGRDCVWLEIWAGEEEILHAETMPQPHVVHPSCLVDQLAETAKHLANLECVAALRNRTPALLRVLKALLEEREANLKDPSLWQQAIMRTDAAIREAEKEQG